MPAAWAERGEPGQQGDSGERRQRIILHFGAVDYRATVRVNGQRVAEHEGGRTPFEADITEARESAGGDSGSRELPNSGTKSGTNHEVVVRAEDDPLTLDQPRGKQTWFPEPAAIWYPRTTGIWQPVWLEPVPAQRIPTVRLTPRLGRRAVLVRVRIEGPVSGGDGGAGPTPGAQG